ncbi:hypothetical protein SAMD00079811_09760 [Scytonema sp. HK-05]|uniref:hypothetical protein n=1 Tax=Scytonema sp. HK-05 TaxID=1137095 RepID=UPI000936F348|nr:hypothetical protein [Scytonema sp. HK-05]OKH58728.1 hypothetical protein NIES2130_12670 [Scytonema sp. HK-05]BAY43396.1 hypothetical protein SAMD00079811_09760 [Scytonema sp. HK-05]
MTTQSITPVRLLRDSLISVLPIYKSLLIFFIPSLILSLSKLVIPKILFSIIDELYFLSIGAVFFEAALFFCYKKLNQEEITISQSLQKAIENFPKILFLRICLSPLLLILFLFPRLYFVFSLVIIKDLSTRDVFKRCWQLTKGYGWQIFWNFLTLILISNVLDFISSLISESIFGVSGELNGGELSTSDPAFVLNRLLTTAINFFVYNPLLTIYVTLMFIRLLALEKRKLGSVAM